MTGGISESGAVVKGRRSTLTLMEAQLLALTVIHDWAKLHCNCDSRRSCLLHETPAMDKTRPPEAQTRIADLRRRIEEVLR